MKGAVQGSLSVRKTERYVAVHQMNQKQDRHLKDSLIFGKTDGQTQICSENNLRRGTTREIPLHHS